MIRILKGGSDSIVRCVDDKYVIKSAHNERGRQKIKEQIEFLNKNKRTWLPKILACGSDWYVMPYYGEKNITRVGDPHNSILDNIEDRKGLALPTGSSFFANYYETKILPLLKSGDIVIPASILSPFPDFTIDCFHGDMTAENCIMAENGLIAFDPNPIYHDDWGTYGMELSKFLCSAVYQYESLKNMELFGVTNYDLKPVFDWEHDITDNIDFIHTLKFLCACHFMRMTPYSKYEKQVREMYNNIMLELLDDMYPDNPRVFDYDGVLVDTTAANEQAFRMAGADILTEGIDEYNYERAYGYGYKEGIPLMFDRNLGEKDIENIHTAKKELYPGLIERGLSKPITHMLDYYLKHFAKGRASIMTLASKECATAGLDYHNIPHHDLAFLKKKLDKRIFCGEIRKESHYNVSFPRKVNEVLNPLVFEDDPECIKILKEGYLLVVEVKK